MQVLAVYAVLAVTPAVAMLLACLALDRWCGVHADGQAPRPLLPGRRRRAPDPAPAPLERLVADLRRLEQDYRRIEASDLPGRVGRLRTVALAYDDVLRACCRALDLPEPADPLSSWDRLQTEAALAQQGVTW